MDSAYLKTPKNLLTNHFKVSGWKGNFPAVLDVCRLRAFPIVASLATKLNLFQDPIILLMSTRANRKDRFQVPKMSNRLQSICPSISVMIQFNDQREVNIFDTCCVSMCELIYHTIYTSTFPCVHREHIGMRLSNIFL